MKCECGGDIKFSKYIGFLVAQEDISTRLKYKCDNCKKTTIVDKG